MIKAVKFYQEIRAGSSLPLVVGGSDGNKYVVKLKGSGDGVLANVVDWLAMKLGQLMQIPVLQPELLLIDTSFSAEVLDPEIKDILKNSVGINLGTRYMKDTFVYNEQNAPDIDLVLKNNIFLYDLFLLNIDRNSRNPNIIFRNGELWCLDYSSSITLRSAIDGKNYREQTFLRQIKRHPFYNNKIKVNDFIKKLAGIADSSIYNLIDELPEEWVCQLEVGKEAKETRKMIGNRLMEKKSKVKSLIKGLEVLRMLKMETEEEQRLRSFNNRKAFELKFGKL